MALRKLVWTGVELQFLVVFISIVFSVGGSTKTTTCPTTRENSGSSKWLLYGMPPKCFPAGLQGPCDPNEVIIPTPTSLNSDYGVCTTNNLTQYQKKIHMDLKSEMRNSRGKRQTKWLRNSLGKGKTPGRYGANGIPKNACPSHQTYNFKLQRCTNSRSEKLLLFIKR